MSWFSNVRDAVLGTSALPLPAIDRLSASPQIGQVEAFVSLDDPGVVEFLRGSESMSAAGVAVNQKKALKNSGVHRAVHLIASSIGMMPFPLYQRIAVEAATTDEEKKMGAKKAREHPIYKLLNKRPNGYMTPFEFKSHMVTRAIFDGVAYARKSYKINPAVKGGREVKALTPLDPKKVTYKIVDGEIVFTYSGPGGPETIRGVDMFWFRSPVSEDGITGTKLVEVALETIGLASQAEKASSNVLKNGAIVGGVLEHPKALSQPAIERLRAQFEERQASPENAGKWIVAEDGLKASIANGSTLKDAQTHEQRKFQIEEIGRFLNVPRPLLFMDETSWGSGIEQLGLFFITYCLLSWFTSIEEAVTRSLLSEAEQDEYFAKFNDGALLRGSLESQANFFSKALGAGGTRGWMTQNEVRDKFDLNAKDGGDDLPQPTATGAAAAGDEAQEPDASGSGQAGKPPTGADRGRGK